MSEGVLHRELEKADLPQPSFQEAHRRYYCSVGVAHIPFVVNRTFNATPTERLQHTYVHVCVSI